MPENDQDFRLTRIEKQLRILWVITLASAAALGFEWTV